MLLAVDTNILVAGLARDRGLSLVAHPTVQLVIAETMWEEVRVEIPRKFSTMAAKGEFNQSTAESLAAGATDTVRRYVQRIPTFLYAPLEQEARVRIGGRDVRDWPTVAVALMMHADIWTADNDFFGCGVATWTTRTLSAYLAFRERTGA